MQKNVQFISKNVKFSYLFVLLFFRSLFQQWRILRRIPGEPDDGARLPDRVLPDALSRRLERGADPVPADDRRPPTPTTNPPSAWVSYRGSRRKQCSLLTGKFQFVKYRNFLQKNHLKSC